MNKYFLSLFALPISLSLLCGGMSYAQDSSEYSDESTEMMRELADKIKLLELERQNLALKQPKFLEGISEIGSIGSQKDGRRLRHLEVKVQSLQDKNKILQQKLRNVVQEYDPEIDLTDISGTDDEFPDSTDHIVNLEKKVLKLEAENKALRGVAGDNNIIIVDTPQDTSEEITLTDSEDTSDSILIEELNVAISSAKEDIANRGTATSPELGEENSIIIEDLETAMASTKGLRENKESATSTTDHSIIIGDLETAITSAKSKKTKEIIKPAIEEDMTIYSIEDSVISEENIKSTPPIVISSGEAFLSAGEIQSILYKVSGENITLTPSPHNKDEKYNYYNWQATNFIGYLDQRPINNEAEYANLISYYLKTVKESCNGKYGQSLSNIEVSSTSSAFYDLSCSDIPTPYIETVVFFRAGGISSTFSTRTPPNNTDIGHKLGDIALKSLKNNL